MSITVDKPCICGKQHRTLTFRTGMPVEVVDRVYCPICIEQGLKNGEAFPVRGGWYLHFNLDVARMFAMAKLGIDPALVNPGFIIDGGYVD